MANSIFNRSLYKRNISRFCNKSIKDDFIYSIAEDIAQEIIDSSNKTFKNVLLYNPIFKSNIHSNGKVIKSTIYEYDEEDMDIGEDKFDLIVSTLSLHLVNNVPKALNRYYKALNHNGIFIATLLGGRSFSQLRLASMVADQKIYGGVFPRVMPTIDPSIAPTLLQNAGFSIPVVSTELYTAQYKSIYDLILDIRNIGHSNCIKSQRNGLESKKYISALSQAYHESVITNDLEILLLCGSKD